MTAPETNAYEFLYEHGNAIIKNEAACHLGLDCAKAHEDMVRHPHVQYWLSCLNTFSKKQAIHGSADDCFENIMYKLLSFGIREEDDSRLPELNKVLIDFMENNRGNMKFYDTINPTIFSIWLSCMGHTDSVVMEVLRQRVETVYGFVKERDYDIYVSPEGYPAIPAARARHPLVNPKLYEGNVWKLPSVHDVFAYAHLPEGLQNEHIRNMVNTNIAYILDERYQRFHHGYGLMLVRPNRYYSMGWSVHLPRFLEGGKTKHSEATVWAMEMMSHYQTARESTWFQRALSHLKSYSDGCLYEFPAEYLSEGKSRYYVGGGHMGLGEDRKIKPGRKLESTAWMMRIVSQCKAQQ